MMWHLVFFLGAYLEARMLEREGSRCPLRGWSTSYLTSLTQKRILLWGADQPAATFDAQAAYKRCARLLLVCSSQDVIQDVVAQVASEEPTAGVCPPLATPLAIGTAGSVTNASFVLELTGRYQDIGGAPDIVWNYV
ncbi:unnamed protein product [Symbiodinium natans]|uniref:Uncharacterized protein n=1 Tax=Symbiodinium natans TaxID=878477 RepID=A0A812R394_9DINO|nr:unnamed protein product [Symbiodinium natans]